MGPLDTFTGSAGKKQALATLQYNQGQAQQGYDASKGYINGGYDNALSRWQPYAQQGQQASSQYGNMLGLNGGDAQKGAMGAYEQYNPYRAASTQHLMQMGDRRAAATGQYGGGMNALARARVADEGSMRDYQDYMGRLQGLGAQGMTASGQMAGLDTGRAQALTGAEQAFRGQNMGAQSAYGQQYSQADSAGLQNLLGLGGLAVQAAGTFGGYYRPQAGGAPQQGNGILGSLQSGNYGNVGQDYVGAGGLPKLGGQGGNNFFSFLRQ